MLVTPPTFRHKVCRGLTRVSLSMNSTDPKFLWKANPTVTIINFKDLENNLTGYFEERISGVR